MKKKSVNVFFPSAESGVIVDMEHFHTFLLELHARSRAAGLSHISGSPGSRIISPLFAVSMLGAKTQVWVWQAQKEKRLFFFT